MYVIKQGLDIPITGQASGDVLAVTPKQVALLGPDYNGMKPTMMVAVGDRVKRGQKLFEDKKNPGVFFTAPAAGTIAAIHRGEKRALLSVVIDKEGDESIQFPHIGADSIHQLTKGMIISNLVESGLWTSFRTRPYSKIPKPDSQPHSIFVTATDTNPLAIDPEIAVLAELDTFAAGVAIISKLTEGKTYLCVKAGSKIDFAYGENIERAEFSGPHPAGLAGTHIHAIDPVNAKKTVWSIGYQDVIAIGRLFLTGELDLNRVIAITGPAAKKPKIVKTVLGADLASLLKDEGVTDHVRVINGSVLNGQKATPETAYLAKYVNQVSLLDEGDHKEFLGWLSPGENKFSATRAYLGGITKKLQAMTTTTNGSPRSLVPIGVYEKVMPLDILPTLLLKAIIVKDTDTAQQLGVLELDEEDLALCTFVCPSKYEYGAILRENLEKIEKEG